MNLLIKSFWDHYKQNQLKKKINRLYQLNVVKDLVAQGASNLFHQCKREKKFY